MEVKHKLAVDDLLDSQAAVLRIYWAALRVQRPNREEGDPQDTWVGRWGRGRGGWVPRFPPSALPLSQRASV